MIETLSLRGCIAVNLEAVDGAWEGEKGGEGCI